MDEFDDFDIGPQADEFASPFDIDTDDMEDIGEDDDLSYDDDDEIINDDNDLRPYSPEWDEDDDEDWDLDD